MDYSQNRLVGATDCPSLQKVGSDRGTESVNYADLKRAVGDEEYGNSVSRIRREASNLHNTIVRLRSDLKSAESGIAAFREQNDRQAKTIKSLQDEVRMSHDDTASVIKERDGLRAGYSADARILAWYTIARALGDGWGKYGEISPESAVDLIRELKRKAAAFDTILAQAGTL